MNHNDNDEDDDDDITEAEIAQFEEEEKTKYRKCLANRICRLRKLTEVDAPDVVMENEKKLIIKAVLDIEPRQLMEVLVDFPNLYRQYMKDFADDED